MAASEEGAWRGFSGSFAGAAVAGFLIVFAFVLAVDPYDSGRTGLLSRHGVPDQYPTTANASRARDPRFDAAIFGNSRVQLLRPERLDRSTGLTFVSLIIPGSGPDDQLVMLRWWLSRPRPAARAVVVGTDARWCAPATEHSERFPTWLYERDFVRYLVGLVRYRSIEAAASRLAFLFGGGGRPGIRPDGYWDYAPFYAGRDAADPEGWRRRVEAAKATAFPANPDGRFPAIEALRTVMRQAPETSFVLLRPPLNENVLPRPGSDRAKSDQACAAALLSAAAERPGIHLIDLLREGPLSAPDNFYDHEHVRDPVAVQIEAMIAARLGGRRAALGGGI